MKESIIFSINIFIIIFCWIFTAYFSMFTSQLVIFSTFIFLAFKGLKYHLFVVYFLFLVLSDSRLDFLAFISSIKPFVSLLFYFIAILIIKESKFSSSLTKIKFLFPFIILVLFNYFINGFEIMIFQKSISYVLIFLIVPFLIEDLLIDNIKLIKNIIYIFVFILLISFFTYYFAEDISFLKGRYRGVFGNPNGLGIFCLLFFFILEFSQKKHNVSFRKYEKIIFLALIFISLILTQSRTCLLAIFIYYVFNFLSKYSVVIAVTFSLFVFIIFGFMSFNLNNILVLLNIENYIRIESIDDASGRYIAWNFLWNEILSENILLGHGIGSTEILFKKNYSFLSMLGHEGNAHNSFLTLLHDNGFFGLIFLLFFIFKSFMNSNNYIIHIPLLLGIFISAFFESWLSASLNPFTILFLFIVVLAQIDSTDEAGGNVVIN